MATAEGEGEVVAWGRLKVMLDNFLPPTVKFISPQIFLEKNLLFLCARVDWNNFAIM